MPISPSRSSLFGAIVIATAALASPGVAQVTPANPPAKGSESRAPAKQPAMEHAGMMRGGVWPAMDQYHLTLMRAWHAANQAGDLAPARANAATLVEHAGAWAASSVPAACGGASTAGEVASISTDSHKLARMVEGKVPDAELKAALAALHERFEKVMGLCSAPDGA